MSSFEEVIDNQGFKAKTSEEKMNIARRFTHEVGELIMKGEDVIGEGAKWAWEELEDGAPGVALRLKHVASVIGGYIGDVIEYGADKVPDFVKDEYREFLSSTTAEERKFWEYAVSLGAAGVLKKLGSGLEKIHKLGKIDGTNGGEVKIDPSDISKQDKVDHNVGVYTTRLTKGKITEYLVENQFDSVEELVRDLNKIGLEIKGKSPDGRFMEFKDKTGKVRLKIHPSDKITKYNHIHIYDKKGNPLNVRLEIVTKTDPSAHIPLKKIKS